MKKSLIALAVAGAFAAPAFAATENVDVYGKLHASVSVFNDQQEDNALTPAYEGAEDIQFSSNASRIGFKGAEDLGGGLSAIWQIESGVELDEKNNGKAEFAGRNSFVGLKGGFGTALIGKHDTPLKLVGRAVDLFGDTMADSRNVMSVASDTRSSNTVAYISPSFSGLTVALAYVNDLGNNPNANNSADMEDNNAFSGNVTYTNGPLFVGGAYSTGDALDGADIDQEWRLAGGFTFGNAKIVGQYDSSEDATAAGNDYTAWMLGGAFTMGNVVLKANYMAGEVDGTNIEPEQFTIGADYNLSKRTSVYALYADGEFVDFGSGAGSSDVVGEAVTGDGASVISLGMVHSF